MQSFSSRLLMNFFRLQRLAVSISFNQLLDTFYFFSGLYALFDGFFEAIPHNGILDSFSRTFFVKYQAMAFSVFRHSEDWSTTVPYEIK